jgi:hypothetical protein
MERCPHCRARFKGEAECYRCGCDLTLLLRVESQAQHLEHFAVQRLACGDLKGAKRALEHAQELQYRPLVNALNGFTRYLARQPRLIPSDDTQALT